MCEKKKFAFVIKFQHMILDDTGFEGFCSLRKHFMFVKDCKCHAINTIKNRDVVFIVDFSS